MADAGGPTAPGDAGTVDDAELLAVLAMIRDRGAIGESSLPRAIAHAEAFAGVLAPSSTAVDLGSGGGLPGLVIAVRRPDVHLTLVERRAARADLLRRGVAALAVGERVEVLTGDVRDVARTGRTFDAVTARSFAAPLEFARLAAPLCTAGGIALVSEPPEASAAADERWPAADLAELGWIDEGRHGSLRVLRRRDS